ncbi:4-oxalocrotonate tautomerase [Virgibacillus natechei]|uniref:Tautomerase n=1 Tax=Virgibacillus natechei TaxID=1216297 RepID=A0ABS4ILB1_9BACI|nr:4-oxalocrotonate tautomerase [Virgibacillus natechei]MBP1971231.1 4-oxalocrotonate tautomerase [Virgibacillus natechei]MBP1971700.1 4-oxalocrotonate tautomerase [Virgibacillus natechei]UZD12138.1 4-oxalocrotonate tautomerase [Virgibacillus natechei]UZD12158.1 4-oxalocrotonate tautomerase [Virgibacillus natechei]
MPLINVQIMEGRSPEKIEAMMENVTNAVSESLDAPKENVRVIVDEVPKTHWAIGGTSAKKLGK